MFYSRYSNVSTSKQSRQSYDARAGTEVMALGRYLSMVNLSRCRVFEIVAVGGSRARRVREISRDIEAKDSIGSERISCPSSPGDSLAREKYRRVVVIATVAVLSIRVSRWCEEPDDSRRIVRMCRSRRDRGHRENARLFAPGIWLTR